MSRLQGVKSPLSLTNIFFSRRMFYFTISLSQYFSTSRDLYRVQVGGGSIRIRNGGPLFTSAAFTDL